MKKSKANKNPIFFSFILGFLMLFSFLNYAWATSPDVNVTALPEYMGDHLGISTEASGILLTLCVMSLLVFPTLFLKPFSTNVTMVMLVVGVIFGTAVSWLNLWVTIMLCLIISGLLATRIKDWF